MATAMAMALPGSLENAAAAVNLTIGKDMAGHRLMMQMARPRSKDPLVWWDVEEKKQRLYEYCMQDVEVERQLEKRLVPLSQSEQQLWWLDQAINDRGVYVDVPLCEAAIKIVDQCKKELDEEMSRVTETGVTACTNRNQLVIWLKEQGIDAESVAKDALAEMLARADLPADVRRALELRREGSKTSVAKVDSLLAGRSRDGRAKGLTQYHAASTGRWGGRRFQPQNLKRPEQKDIDTLCDLLGRGDHKLFSMMYENPVSAIGDAVRSMVRAAPGRKLVTADFSNIEGRVAAWYCGEEWKLKAFREFDAGTGHDLYKLAYARSFGIDPAKVDSFQRQVGKVQELALQYRGGHGAYVAMAAGYGIDLSDVTKAVRAAVHQEKWQKAESRFRPQNAFGMDVDDWTALRIVIDGWRYAHPQIKQSWTDLEDAAEAAVRNPGETYAVGACKFKVKGSFLWLRLPSGRCLCYPYPRIKQKLMPWLDDNENPVYRETLCFMGVDSFTKQWQEQFAHGGVLLENIVQATARDILAEAIVRVEQAGYPVVLHVHDEIVTEPKSDFGSIGEFSKIMSVVPAWAEGLPIAAAGYESLRYKKA